MTSAGQPEQGSQPPSRGQPHQDHETNAHNAARCGAFAPALEHGNHSNHKQYDRGSTQNLEPHVLLSSSWEVATGHAAPEVRASQPDETFSASAASNEALLII